MVVKRRQIKGGDLTSDFKKRTVKMMNFEALKR